MSTSDTSPRDDDDVAADEQMPVPVAGPENASELVGTAIADRFRLVRLASEGANTAIYDSVDEQTGRAVTVKLVQPRRASSPTFRTEFNDTMRSVAALSHANIAAVFDWGIASVGATSTAYVVIEQLTGGSLRDLFDRGRRLTPSQALAVGLDVCKGLDYAHRRGLVHGELTPSKLVFGDDRRLRIVDFGLARLLGEPMWRQPDSVPTHVAWYAAPEQGAGTPIDGSADVYALALTLHEAVTGVLPFKDDSTVATNAARVGRLMPVSADLGALASVLERAGRPMADERSTAAEFGKGLVQIASKLPRPEPIPLLSTGLFDVPAEQLRTPDDPTGGVARPTLAPTGSPVMVVPVDEPDARDHDDQQHDDQQHDDQLVADDASPADPVIVEAEPDAVIPSVDPDDDLVILPIDSDLVAPRVAAGSPVRTPPSTVEMPVTAAVAPAADAPPVPRRRRGVPWKILLGLVVVASLVGLGVLATKLFETPVYPVPELVGMPEAEARNLIAANGWEVTVGRERSDVTPTVGQVVRTTPSAGVDLAEGEPFLIVSSDGPTLRELPESTGVLASEAQTRLVERALDVQVVEAFDENVPAGSVVSWSVPGDATLVAGSMVEPATSVELVVSIGPAARAIPGVVGLAGGAARAAVESLQLVYQETGQEFSDEVPIGVVIRQSLEPGTEVPRGSQLDVVVSKGPDLVIFPDLSTAATFDDAAALVRAAGFDAVLTFGDAQGAVRTVTVAGVAPGPGETFRRGTLVEFTAL